MPEAFDPYHKWLGIPPEEQPPNHYRLLGIKLFEDDADVIDSAADKQMSHVHGFQRGPYGEECHRLLTELSAARICLLNEQKKAAYDEGLRSEVRPPTTSAKPSPTLARPGPARPTGKKRKRLKRKEHPPVESSAKQPESQTAVLTELGDYRLQEKLGEGGMGAVYKAVQTKLDKVVALKILAKGRIEDQEAIARFEREMKAVGRLDHPNIVQAHDAREIEGTSVLVMEYVDGMDLNELIRRTGPLPVADACELILQAAVGLQYAHEHGLVHRDVKPSNLMITRRGQIKLLDLGLARFQVGGQPAGREVTVTGQAVGTPDYMAPEQIADTHTVDIRADIYALGCTLYKLLAGRPPFGGAEYKTAFDKQKGHVDHTPPPIERLRADSPDELIAVIDRMLVKDPEERFATPGEVAAALEPFAAGCDLPGLLKQAKIPAPEAEGELAGRTEAYRASPLAGTRMQVSAATKPTKRPVRRRWKRIAIVAAVAGVVLLGVILALNRYGLLKWDFAAEFDVSGDPDRLPGCLPGPVKLRGIGRYQLDRVGRPRGILSLVWSPDGSRIACGTKTGHIWIYDAKDLRLKQLLSGHTAAVPCIAWNPDGTLLASGSRDKTIRLWNRDGTLNLVLKGHAEGVNSVAWSRDGELLASGSGDNTVRVWKPDGALERVFEGHLNAVRSVAWSPDGRLTSASNDKTVRLWQPDGKPGPVLEHPKGVPSVAWSSDGKHLLSANSPVKLWKTDDMSEAPVKNKDGNPQNGHYVSWSPVDNRFVIAGGRHVLSWDAKGKPGPYVEFGSSYYPQAVSWSPDGTQLASVVHNGSVRFLNADLSGRGSLKMHTPYQVVSLATSRDGDRLAASNLEKSVRLWHADGTPGPVIGMPELNFAIAWSPDGKLLANGCRACSRTPSSVVIWGGQTQKRWLLLKDGDKPDNTEIHSVCFSPDGKRVAAALKDTTVRLWQPDGKPGPVLKGHEKPVRTVAWNPNGEWLASGSDDNRVRLWQENGKAGPVLKGHAAGVNCVAWSSDGTQLASASTDKTARLWELDGKPGPVLEGHEKPVNSVAWSPDDSRLASAADDSVRIWKANGAAGKVLRWGKKQFYSVIWPGDRIMCGGRDNTIFAWDANSGNPQWVGLLLPGGKSATFSTTGEIIDGDPGLVEKEFVYLVEKPSGVIDVLTPSEFQKLTGD